MQPTPETRLTDDIFAELIAHRSSAEASESVGAVFDRINARPEEFCAVVRGGRYLGLVAKAQLGLLLSGRFGYSLFARQPVSKHLLEQTVTVSPGELLLDVLDRALNRSGQEFHQDLAAVDAQGNFLGIIEMPRLVRLQNEVIVEQTRRAEEQRHAMQHQELQLFRSQQRLRQSEGRFGILFEKGPLGFALLDTEGMIELFNGRLAELLELPASIERANFSACLVPKQRERFERMLSGFREVREDDSAARSLELRFERPGAEPRVARCDFHWVKETAQIWVCVQDISAQRRLEQRVQQKEKSAMLDSLAGGIAHELNNKLMPVLGFAELLGARAGLDPELTRPCEIIRQSVVEAADLVGQLLHLSRPPTLEPRATDLVGIVQAAVGILRFRFREASCEPSLRLPEQPVPLMADPAQLKQVLVNLCLNALDAMAGSGRSHLEITLCYEEGGARLRVRDTGPGISAENLPRIFDPFFTTKGVQQGTGLGLSVCFSIVQQHGGTIEVESTGPEGTMFALWLPLAEAARSSVDAIAEKRAATEATAATENRTVLVVDDEEFIVTLIHEMLRKRFNCRVLRAGSAEEGVAKLEAVECDLVISDVRLPGQNGLDLYQEVKRRWPELSERFFFITGDAGGRELTQALAATGRAVLRKPFSLDALANEAQRHFAMPRLRVVTAA